MYTVRPNRFFFFIVLVKKEAGGHFFKRGAGKFEAGCWKFEEGHRTMLCCFVKTLVQAISYLFSGIVFWSTRKGIVGITLFFVGGWSKRKVCKLEVTHFQRVFGRFQSTRKGVRTLQGYLLLALR